MATEFVSFIPNILALLVMILGIVFLYFSPKILGRKLNNWNWVGGIIMVAGFVGILFKSTLNIIILSFSVNLITLFVIFLVGLFMWLFIKDK